MARFGCRRGAGASAVTSTPRIPTSGCSCNLRCWSPDTRSTDFTPSSTAVSIDETCEQRLWERQEAAKDRALRKDAIRQLLQHGTSRRRGWSTRTASALCRQRGQWDSSAYRVVLPRSSCRSSRGSRGGSYTAELHQGRGRGGGKMFFGGLCPTRPIGYTFSTDLRENGAELWGSAAGVRGFECEKERLWRGPRGGGGS